ncbi:MAG: biopolymer transporter ExbD [Pseudomonadota bacterium]
MRNRFTRKHRSQESGDINITAFMNLMVILVPFLLITAVFSRITILELNLPAAASTSQQDIEQNFHLEIVVRSDGIEVGDRDGGLIKRLPLKDGNQDYEELSTLLQQVKARFPEKADATLLLEPDTEYETMVHVMDNIRTARVVQAGSVISAELFPEISIGDAPDSQMQVAKK